MSYMNLGITAAQVALTSYVVLHPQRGLYSIAYTDSAGKSYSLPDIVAQATIEERVQDESEVTDHPVEIGSTVSDHMFKLPIVVDLRLGWSMSPSVNASPLGAIGNSIAAVGSVLTGANATELNSIYNSLVALETTKALFTIYTGKRILQNMVCKSLTVENDWRTENSLFVRMACKEIIMVNTQSVALPASVQANPLATASPLNNGTKSLKPVAPPPAVSGW